jgi:hypothetical protein
MIRYGHGRENSTVLSPGKLSLSAAVKVRDHAALPSGDLSRRYLLVVLVGYATQKAADSGNESDCFPLSSQFA